MRLIALTGIVLGTAVTAQPLPAPPVAAPKPHEIVAPSGAKRTDEYYWLRDDTRKNPEMLAYLTAENSYTDAVMAPATGLKETLLKEYLGRLKQDDSSVPYLDRGYYHYTRYDKGADYPVIARRKGSLTAPEEILLDQPAMARGHGFFAIRGGEISDDDRLLAFTMDTVGRGQFTLRIKDLATGTLLADEVPNVESGLAWAADNKTILYVEKDPVTLLSKRIKAHVLGTPASADRLVYEEKDASFYIGIGRTKSGEYVCISEQSTLSNEQRCAPTSAIDRWTVLAPRARDFRYSADHAGGRWVIRTDWNAKNYKVMQVADADFAKGRAAWRDLVPASKDVFVDDVAVFNNMVALVERRGGNKTLRILRGDGQPVAVNFDEPAYSVDLGDNRDPAATRVRMTYASLVTPVTTYDVDARTGARTTLKVTDVPGYDATRYVTERVWIAARDGVRVPVSLVRARTTKVNGTAPLFQYGYGSYGASMDPAFNAPVISLLDRGFVYAIAHVRGGQELGRDWYDQGHLMTKMNSFTDFIDVTRGLAKLGYSDPTKVAASGRSAGGLLMGAIANMAPNDYRVIVAGVPFVDAVTTMLDPSIPLTTNEYDEWGNPEDKRYYDYILSYSPYDNVARKAYPALYVSTGLWDSQVQYYEPAKWVARLRARKTDRHPLVFRTNMEAGHGGKSGRLQRYEESAESTAFVLSQIGISR